MGRNEKGGDMKPILTQNAHYVRITELEKQRDDLVNALTAMLTAIKAVDAVADYGPELMPAIYQATRAIENTEVKV